MTTRTANSLKIAAGVMRDLEDGVRLNDAVRKASAILGISPAAVCAALTVAQDYLADTKV